MFKFCVSALVAMSLFSGTALGFEFREKKNLPKTPDTIELDPSNTVTLRGPVDDKSVSKLIKDIANSPSDEVFVVITSPGGSVLAGMKAISYIRASEKKITCFADIAISMAFVILEACDLRLSNYSSISMQHVTSYGLNQQQAPNAESFVKFLTRMAELMDIAQAKRIGISYAAFKAKTRSDWWSFGTDLAEEGVTDRNANLTCSKKAFKETLEEILNTPFGQFQVTWSACPLVSAPLDVKAKRFSGTDMQFKSFVDSLNIRDNVTTQARIRK